jgi:hypothetical protein
MSRSAQRNWFNKWKFLLLSTQSGKRKCVFRKQHVLFQTIHTRGNEILTMEKSFIRLYYRRIIIGRYMFILAAFLLDMYDLMWGEPFLYKREQFLHRMGSTIKCCFTKSSIWICLNIITHKFNKHLEL